MESIEDKIIPEPNSGCWLWIGARTTKGYGHMKRRGKYWLVHRYIYTYFHGPIPDDKIIRHTCDNVSCVNPDHLLLGTYYDNMLDQIARGHFRPPKGKLQPLQFYRNRRPPP